MLARSRGVPAVVGLGIDLAPLTGHAIVDAQRGLLIVNPGQAARAQFSHDAQSASAARALCGCRGALRPAVTRDGTPIRIMLNVADPAELDVTRSGDMRRHRTCSHRVSVPRPARTSRRRASIRGLPPHRRMGAGAAGHHPDAGCRRRQADSATSHPRPRATRSSACAACVFRFARPDVFAHPVARPRPRRRSRQREDHAADGDAAARDST